MVVMREHEVRFAVAVDVARRSALGLIAVGDEVTLPHHALRFRILVPPQPVQHPARRHHIRGAVMVDVEGPFSAVGDELPQNAHGAVLMAYPFATRWSRILIPISAA